MRQVFNSIFAPMNLVSHLSEPAIVSTLRRLRVQGLITEQQWTRIFSSNKAQISSDNFEASLLFVLLKNISPITPPYPEGWHRLPQHDDLSLAADLVRLQSYRTLLINKLTENNGRVEEKEYRTYWEQIKQVLIRLGGSKVKARIDQMERQNSTTYRTEDTVDYVKELLEWDRRAKDISAKEMALDKKQKKGSSNLTQINNDAYTQIARNGSSGKPADSQQPDVMKSQKDRQHQKHYQKRRSSNHNQDVNTLTKEGKIFLMLYEDVCGVEESPPHTI